jgi:hypothetical protein
MDAGGRRIAKLFEEHPVATEDTESSSAGFEQQIRLAKAAETEACRSYHRHVNSHDCV